MIDLDDVFVENNFFSHDLIKDLWKDCLKLDNNAKDFIDHHGVWKGKLVTRQNIIKEAGVDVNYENYSQSLKTVIGLVSKYFNNDVFIREICFQQLYLPWDIHCDLTRFDIDQKDIYKSSNKKNYIPFYNVLIPLHDVDSRTIIFNQSSTDYNDFWKYKQNNPKVDFPISEKIWNQYLDMCWPEDRLWLTIKKILPAQRAGQLIAFKRHYFHSSDNFHSRGIKSKHFVQLLLDKKSD